MRILVLEARVVGDRILVGSAVAAGPKQRGCQPTRHDPRLNDAGADRVFLPELPSQLAGRIVVGLFACSHCRLRRSVAARNRTFTRTISTRASCTAFRPAASMSGPTYGMARMR